MENTCKIKICGLFRLEDAKYVNEAMPDAIGFIFVRDSRRVVSMQEAEGLRQLMDPRIAAVGVFRRAKSGFIARLVLDGIIQMVQLHGGEDEAYIQELREQFDEKHRDTPIIRAVTVSEAPIEVPENCSADYLLFDQGTGGTGKRFDIQMLRNALQSGRLPKKPYFIAGGVDLENIRDILKEEPYGIDVSSGVETNGVKDRQKIIEIVKAVRQ